MHVCQKCQNQIVLTQIAGVIIICAKLNSKMDLLFAINKKTTKNTSYIDSFPESPAICCVSSTNVVAFSAVTELDDNTGKTWGSHVYVADLNSPWLSYKVLSSSVPISVLQWDLTGDLLLVADQAGCVRFYRTKDHLLNNWYLAHTVTLQGEHIIAAAFFHSGKKVCWNAEKKDTSLYTEKFQHVRFACSVKQFGGRPSIGALLLTTTGMLASIVLPHHTSHSSPIVTTESLSASRNHITTVDICYGKNGHFLLAVSSGNVTLPIQCYRVSVRKVDEKCIITSQALPGFFLQDATKDSQIEPVIADPDSAVTHLRWVVREDADALVVASNGVYGGCLHVWELQEKSMPVHPLLGGTESFNTVLWQHQAQFRHTAKVVALATSKLTISNSVSATGYVMLALSDNTVHCLFRDSLKHVSSATMSLGSAWNISDEPLNKYSKKSIIISYLDMSWLGNVLLVIDNQSQLYLYRLPPSVEPGSPMTVPHATTLLEYCLVTGLDWLDLMLVLRPGMLEALCDRLTESFNRQTPAIQQFYYVQYLSIKTSLYRLSASGQNKANDLTSLLMLHSIATAFKSLLRPSDLSCHDKSPADSLSGVMTEGQNDVDKVLMHLEAKEFTVEPSTLQSLQQLIQWVSDLALNLLAKLPDSRPSTNKSYELLRDVKALNTLRELLVIIRIWGLLRQSCLPVFVRSAETLDVLALLFRLLSRLAQNPNEPDDTLIDECCLLPSQVLIPQLNQISNRIALASPQLAQQILPLQLEYLSEPEFLICNNDQNFGGQTVDSIRHLYLGTTPGAVKQCVRCSSSAGTQPATRTAAIRAWDQRWIRSCQCGGLWRYHANIL